MKLTRELTKGTKYSAGLDLCAHTVRQVGACEDGQLLVTMGTGVKVQIPVGWVGLVTLRSSWAAKGITMSNAPGIIDSDYRGEVMLILRIPKKFIDEFGGVQPGARLAQLVVVPHYNYDNVEVTDVLDKSERGEGGLGSTGGQPQPKDVQFMMGL